MSFDVDEVAIKKRIAWWRLAPYDAAELWVELAGVDRVTAARKVTSVLGQRPSDAKWQVTWPVEPTAGGVNVRLEPGSQWATVVRLLVEHLSAAGFHGAIGAPPYVEGLHETMRRSEPSPTALLRFTMESPPTEVPSTPREHRSTDGASAANPPNGCCSTRWPGPPRPDRSVTLAVEGCPPLPPPPTPRT